MGSISHQSDRPKWTFICSDLNGTIVLMQRPCRAVALNLRGRHTWWRIEPPQGVAWTTSREANFNEKEYEEYKQDFADVIVLTFPSLKFNFSSLCSAFFFIDWLKMCNCLQVILDEVLLERKKNSHQYILRWFMYSVSVRPAQSEEYLECWIELVSAVIKVCS